jgi:hypothetical protein
MTFKPSDRLKLRVEALGSRLREVSEELSATNGAAFQVRERLHAETAQALMEGRPLTGVVQDLKVELQRHEAALPPLLEQEEHLKQLHFAARRDHLRQLRKDNPGRWLVLE